MFYIYSSRLLLPLQPLVNSLILTDQSQQKHIILDLEGIMFQLFSNVSAIRAYLQNIQDFQEKNSIRIKV